MRAMNQSSVKFDAGYQHMMLLHVATLYEILIAGSGFVSEGLIGRGAKYKGSGEIRDVGGFNFVR